MAASLQDHIAYADAFDRQIARRVHRCDQHAAFAGGELQPCAVIGAERTHRGAERALLRLRGRVWGFGVAAVRRCGATRRTGAGELLLRRALREADGDVAMLTAPQHIEVRIPADLRGADLL